MENKSEKQWWSHNALWACGMEARGLQFIMQLRRQQEPYNSCCEAAELSCSQQFSPNRFIKIPFCALQHNFCLRQ